MPRNGRRGAANFAQVCHARGGADSPLDELRHLLATGNQTADSRDVLTSSRLLSTHFGSASAAPLGHSRAVAKTPRAPASLVRTPLAKARRRQNPDSSSYRVPRPPARSGLPTCCVRHAWALSLEVSGRKSTPARPFPLNRFSPEQKRQRDAPPAAIGRRPNCRRALAFAHRVRRGRRGHPPGGTQLHSTGNAPLRATVA